MVYCEVPMRHSFNLTSFHCHHFYSCSRYCKIVQRRIIFSQNTFQDLVFSPQNFVFNPQHRRLFTFKQIDVKGELWHFTRKMSIFFFIYSCNEQTLSLPAMLQFCKLKLKEKNLWKTDKVRFIIQESSNVFSVNWIFLLLKWRHLLRYMWLQMSHFPGFVFPISISFYLLLLLLLLCDNENVFAFDVRHHVLPLWMMCFCVGEILFSIVV